MRTLMKVHMPVEAGNKALLDGSLPRLIQRTIEEIKPEACYFLSEQGRRTAYFFFDLKDPSQIPALAEPFFMGVNADVEFLPVMNVEDLKAGLERASLAFAAV
jgi:hypothetical protein